LEFVIIGLILSLIDEAGYFTLYLKKAKRELPSLFDGADVNQTNIGS
jgi:hypothetical protein